MEALLDETSDAVVTLANALEDYAEIQAKIQRLSKYYGSDQWRSDFSADEAGRLPKSLRRGVLSEDGLWNLLSDCRELSQRLREASEMFR